MTTLQRYFLEPMSMLTHLVGAIASLLGTLLLLGLTRHAPPKFWVMLVYGSSMVILYSSSTLFHGVKLPEPRRMWLNRLDHMAIFLLIAGTYTPIVTTFFPRPWRELSLLFVWGAATLGILYKLFSPRIHGFFNASIYVAMSWGGALPLLFASRIVQLIPPAGFALLLLGGLIYSAGFVVYYWQRPDPWPNVFGHHEIWHLFVMGGSLCHFLFMLFVVVPA
ncbi:MAG: hemolysin III family protein [Anaerolineales bacterium]|nr:hemolysin III family protein [Anaerolineales bacterium]